jgi:hypothetical protein
MNKPQRHWQQFEINFLMKSRKAGIDYDEIAAYLGRTRQSVVSYFHHHKHIYFTEIELT